MVYSQTRQEYQAAWYRNNRERILRDRAAYRSVHKEAAREYMAMYYVGNHAKLRDYNESWRAARPEYDSLRRIKNRKHLLELQVIYHATHPNKAREHCATRRARKRGAFIETVSPPVVFERDQGLCGICQEAVDPTNWHLDHIQPLSRGGEHSYKNTQVAHPVCNMRKGNR